MDEVKRRIRQRRRRRRFFTTLILAIIIIGGASLPIFNITKADLIGTQMQEVQNYADNLIGKNINWHKLLNMQKDLETLPFVKKAEVKRHFPNRISINIIERKKTSFAYIADIFIEISEDGIVLSVNEGASAGLFELKGLESAEAKIGAPFAPIGTDNYNNYTAVTESFADYGIIDGIKYIDFSITDAVSIMYNEMLIDFGNQEQIDNKMKLLAEIISKNPSNTRAEIDVSSGEKAYFKEIY